MKIFYIAEIIGDSGVWAVKQSLKDIKEKEKIDVVIANGDSCAFGFGILQFHFLKLRSFGVDVITMGEKSFFKKGGPELFDNNKSLLRPFNLGKGYSGNGYYYKKHNDNMIAIITLIGSIGSVSYPNNPFDAFDRWYEKTKEMTPLIFVDFHSQSTAEKAMLGFHVKGRASVMVGSHQKVQTADETILQEHTGFITDAGRTGSALSVGGFSPDNEIIHYKRKSYEASVIEIKNLEIQGIIVEINDQTGQTISIKSVKNPIKEEYDERLRISS